jgi:hypothetical protein
MTLVGAYGKRILGCKTFNSSFLPGLGSLNLQQIDAERTPFYVVLPLLQTSVLLQRLRRQIPLAVFPRELEHTPHVYQRTLFCPPPFATCIPARLSNLC